MNSSLESRPEVVLRGERVLLRPAREADLPRWIELSGDPELRRLYGGSGPPPARPTLAEAREWLAGVRHGDRGHHFAIEVGGLYVGGCRFHGLDPASRRARYAIGINDRRYWGQGYGTEATRLMLRHGFEALSLHRIDLRVLATNVRAIRCYEKCGFRREGVERESCLIDGEWHDDVIMAILELEWQATQE